MVPDTNTVISANEDNQDFPRVTRNADANESMVELDSTTYYEMTEDEKIDIVAKRILNRYRYAFEVLAQ